MNTDHANPYIGPRTFLKEEGHLFFGRDREAADLEALVASERMVLFYAQSGAGKSSLINARLIPRLEGKEIPFEILSARVSGDAPQGMVVENIYIYNLIHSLVGRETDPQLFCTLTLPRFLEKLNEEEDGYFYDPDLAESLRSTFTPPWPRMLIIDQFEELFSTNVEAWQKREDFFRQLAQAMQDDPFLWILLVMREDFIASLDPYAHLLPKGLRVRYYMERLSNKAAIQAIRNPVEHLRPYAPGVAEKLAEDLSRVKVQKPDGTTGTEPGQYIEPVQLQVVCHGLWENLPPGGTEITEKDLQDVGDVNQSLARYYDRRVGEVARAKQVKERLIRDWFDEKLIAAGGIRNIVLQEREVQPGGLDDEVIQALQSDLVRSEKRGGATWYELTHDRLVEPILASNKKWFEENLNPLQRQARLWEDQGRNDNWLLRDQAYTEVEAWADEHQDELTGPEREFLEESRKQRDQQLQSTRRTRLFIAAVSTFAVVAIILSIFVFRYAQAAKIQAEISRVGELAAQSMSLRDKNFLVSLLLGVEAYNGTNERITSVQAQSALLGDALANPQLNQFLNGHAASVLTVAIHPDGKMLASGGYDPSILLWDMETRQQVGELSGHSSLIRTLAFSPDGKTLASGSDDHTILLWDVKNPKQVDQIDPTLSGHSASVLSVAFSPDGKMLASGSDDRTIRLWDVKTGKPLGQPLSGHSGPVQSVAFSPDGKMLASGSYDRTIILWDMKTGKPLGQPLSGHSGPVLSVAFSPDGNILASSSIDQTIMLWDVKTHKPIDHLSGHWASVRSVAFSPDSKMLASGSYDKTIILWDMETRKPIGQPLKGHANIVNNIVFSPDGKTLVSGGGDKTVALWDMQTHQRISRELSGKTSRLFHAGPVPGVAFSPDGKTLASGGGDGTILLWDMESRKPVCDPLMGHIGPVQSLAFSPDGKTLAYGSMDQTILLWRVKACSSLGELRGHTGPVIRVAFSPDGQTLASGSNDKTILLWDVQTGKPTGQPLAEHTDAVNDVAFSPDGKMLASGSEDSTVILWDAITHQPIGQPLSGHSKAVTSVVFSPDGKMLASGSEDSIIILWDVETHQATGHLSGHLNLIYSLAFSPDGKTLVSGSYDQTIILWDVKTRQPIGQPFSGHLAPVQSLAFSPDGKTLASSSANILLWDLRPQTWINESCRRAGRNLTRAEWEIYLPSEEYRKTCPEFPLEPFATPTATP